MEKPKITMLPRFMGNTSELYFTLQIRAAVAPRAHIVFIPPFGEEMNRCRALVAEQAKSFSAAGFLCTLIDFFGTGDSQGELRQVSLQHWHDNISQTLETLLQEHDLPIILWGLRLGGLIALDYVAKHSIPVKEIVLWQPVTAGKMYVTQVLRQRVASLMVKDLPAETTKEIRQRLAQGEEVEVAGYTLGGRLLDDLEAIDVKSMPSLCRGSIHWLEHVTEAGKDPGVAAQKAISLLQEQNNKVEVHTFSDPQIWQIHERDFAPQLLAATDGLIL